MKKFKNILSLFPQPNTLTEVTILSIYEIVAYLAIFLICLWLYNSLTTVTVREIEIQKERIDDRVISDSTSLANAASRINAFCNTIINVPLSRVDYNAETINYRDNEILHYLPTHTQQLPERDNNHYIDSLWRFYKSITPADSSEIKRLVHNDYQLIIYHRIKSTFYNWSWGSINQSPDWTNKYGHILHNKYEKDSIKNGKYITTNEFFGPSEGNISLKETGGLYSAPKWYYKYDISQFYYKIRIQTHTLDSIKLHIHFRGANEFTFVNIEPDEIDCQDLVYNLKNNYGVIDTEIILHIKSKELDVIQNARIFFITALLSALITIFLAFLIIFFYRLIRYISTRFQKTISKVGDVEDKHQRNTKMRKRKKRNDKKYVSHQ